MSSSLGTGGEVKPTKVDNSFSALNYDRHHGALPNNSFASAARCSVADDGKVLGNELTFGDCMTSVSQET